MAKQKKIKWFEFGWDADAVLAVGFRANGLLAFGIFAFGKVLSVGAIAFSPFFSFGFVATSIFAAGVFCIGVVGFSDVFSMSIWQYPLNFSTETYVFFAVLFALTLLLPRSWNLLTRPANELTE